MTKQSGVEKCDGDIDKAKTAPNAITSVKAEMKAEIALKIWCPLVDSNY